MLAQHFLNLYQEKSNKKAKRFSEKALFMIEQHDWPGNARELENMVKRAVVLAESNRIKTFDLGFAPEDDEDSVPSLDLKTVRDQAERDIVKKVLKNCNGKIAKAAKVLGITRPTLYDLIDRHGLK